METENMQDKVAAELKRLADSNDGRLTPEAVVEAAADPDSILHTAFQWDDSEAAHAYRVEQARTLIRSVRVTITTETATVKSIAYVRDPEIGSSEQGYIATAAVRSDSDLSREVLLTEFGRVASALKRARKLAAALEMSEEVDSLIAGVADLRAKVEPAHA